jgi:hypothetical protein
MYISEKAKASQFQLIQAVQPDGNPTTVNNKMPYALDDDAYCGLVGRKKTPKRIRQVS